MKLKIQSSKNSILEIQQTCQPFPWTIHQVQQNRLQAVGCDRKELKKRKSSSFLPLPPNRTPVIPDSEATTSSSVMVMNAHPIVTVLSLIHSCSSPWFALPRRRRSGSSCCRTGRGRRGWPSTTSRSRTRRSTRSSTR